ncbi:MAG TPA: hypothetical protein PLL20_16025 [Phycisphaerae bacterium]|nr:hypothetical protein [Phycisphaerae bacterium]HRR84825.1 hypothetical protein [Phycisphaerae bacterium]
MSSRILIFVYVLLPAALAQGDWELYVNKFCCQNADAEAKWDANQDTDVWNDGPTLWVYVQCYFNDNDWQNNYKYKMRFSGGENEAAEISHTTQGCSGDYYGTTLSQKLSTGGNRYYKDYDLTIYAQVRNTDGQQLDSESNTMTFRFRDTSWKIPTQTDITSPVSSVYKWSDIKVKGTVKRKPEEGGNWIAMDNHYKVKVELDHAGNHYEATVQTGNGGFEHTFAQPQGGWDSRVSVYVYATFLSGQFDPADPPGCYVIEYQSSSDSGTYEVTDKRDEAKSTWESLIQATGTITIQNPTDDALPDGSTWAYDLDGTLLGWQSTMAPPPHGVIVIDEDTLDDDLTALAGTIAMDQMIPGYETWAAPGRRGTAAAPGQNQPGPQAWIATLAFQLPSGPMFGGEGLGWRYTTAWVYDPPESTALLTMRFYDMSGRLLHTKQATVNAYQRFEVPKSWLTGAAAMHAELSQGHLLGWALAEDLTYDAFETTAQTSVAAELIAPYVTSEADWQTMVILHNPTDSAALVVMEWYHIGGAFLGSLPELIAPKATMTFDADHLGPPALAKSVRVRVLEGEGIIGSCVRTTNEATTMAESMVRPASSLRIPSPGVPLLQDGLLVMHNPEEEPVTIDLRLYGLDGTPQGGAPMELAPHMTEILPLIPPLPGQPVPSFEMRASGGGRFAAIAMFHQPDSGGAASVPALPMSERFRCGPPWLQGGWNLISIPLDSDNPNVTAVLAALEQAGNALPGHLLRYRADAYQAYPDEMTTLARGEGYWLRLDQASTFSVRGKAAKQNVLIGLTDGWNLIGCPTDVPVLWAACSVSDGSQTKTVTEAGQTGWIQSTLLYHEPVSGYRLVIPGETGDDAYLRPCQGYWLRAFRHGLILVVPPEGGAAGILDAGAETGSSLGIQITGQATATWSFRAAVDPAASDELDALDLMAPPAAPAGLAELRLTTTPDFQGPRIRDYREPPCGSDEVWEATASLAGLGAGHCEQATMTWDLSNIGSYSYTLVDVTGQQNVDLSPGGQYLFRICEGQDVSFEIKAKRTGLTPADLDCDADVDGADADLFENCATSPGVSLSPGCDRIDFDQDGDADQTDFAFFQRCCSGENVPADPSCAER